jgi:hypothetical protein
MAVENKKDMSMKKNLMVGAGVGACAVACAGVALLPALLGGGTLALGGAAALLAASYNEVILRLAAAALVLAGIWLLLRRKGTAAKPDACVTDGSCGCKPGVERGS